MLLILDDIRDFKDITSLYHRRMNNLKPFTENQKIILQKYRRKYSLVRNYSQAVEYINHNSLPEMIMFDHDLGEEKTGYCFLKWLCNQNLGYFDAYFHTANPIGLKNMEIYYNNYLKFFNL